MRFMYKLLIVIFFILIYFIVFANEQKLVKITTDTGNVLIGYIKKITKDKIFLRNKYGNFVILRKELRRKLVLRNKNISKLNYLSCASFELDYDEVWKVNWMPEWAGITLYKSAKENKTGKSGLFLYTTGVNQNQLSHTWVNRRDFIFWNKGVSAKAWIWFNASNAQLPKGYLYLKINFLSGDEVLKSHIVKLDKKKLKKKYKKKWGKLFLQTPPAPEKTNRIDFVFGVYKHKGDEVQCKVYIDNAFLTSN